MESIPYPNHGRHVIGAERERYAKIAAERYTAGATIQVIAEELGRSASFVNGLLHRDTDVKIRPRSVPGRRVSTSDGDEVTRGGEGAADERAAHGTGGSPQGA